MLAIISLIFLFIVIGQLEADMISNSQAIIYATYGLIMFYNTSKKYWHYSEHKKTINNFEDLERLYKNSENKKKNKKWEE